MLDSYMSSTCYDSWGRSSFARCLIEVNSEADLLDFVTIGIPSLEGNDFIKETIRVEYEWKPPRCETCKIFGHTNDCCPKKVVAAPSVDNTNDGFQHVVNKKRNNKANKTGNKFSKCGYVAKGVPISKGTFIYQPKAAIQTSNGDGARGNVGSKAGPKPLLNKDGTSTSNVGSTSSKDVPNQPVNQHNKKGSNYPTPRGQGMNGVDKAKMKISNIFTPNPFAPLEEDEDDEVENI
ncbi:zinc knuckle CX2CX4HX4C containing protein [Tanacetum coccineum]